MFDFDATKLLIVGVIALICIPPKDLPRALRTAGQFVGKMRRMASEFQGQFMDAMREADMADVRREAQKLAESARVDVGLHDVEHTMTGKPKLADESGQVGAGSKPVNERTDVVTSDAKPPQAEPSEAKQLEAEQLASKASEQAHSAPSAAQEAKAEPASHTA